MQQETSLISDLNVAAYTVPTDFPESDGTLKWSSTTMVLVEIKVFDVSGLGYTYGDQSICSFIAHTLKPLVLNKNALDIPFIFDEMSKAIRNEGHAGMAYMAISAVDNALWDLKAKLLSLPLCQLIGIARDRIQIYGSGGFTSYDEEKLNAQLGAWVQKGFLHVKMKIGRDPDHDVNRIQSVRKAIGSAAEIFVDANGAYSIKQSLQLAESFKDFNVSWFEEPVPSFNLEGLKFIREHAPPAIRIAAGEYGYHPDYFLKMIQHQSVDVLQADATRCGGITGFIKVADLCEAYRIPFSFHCAPAQHLHPSLCLHSFFIGEYFHDHVRIEELFFDGVAEPENGYLSADLSRPGSGLTFKWKDAEKFRKN